MSSSTSLDSLLNDFLIQTLLLEKKVLEEDSDPDDWIVYLDKRQEIIDLLNVLFEQGISLTNDQKKNYLQPSYEVDQRIVPVMEQKKNELELDFTNAKRSKTVNQQYGDYGNSYSPYGAFFDTKK